jgi:hypothetical protein
MQVGNKMMQEVSRKTEGSLQDKIDEIFRDADNYYSREQASSQKSNTDKKGLAGISQLVVEKSEKTVISVTHK